MMFQTALPVRVQFRSFSPVTCFTSFQIRPNQLYRLFDHLVASLVRVKMKLILVTITSYRDVHRNNLFLISPHSHLKLCSVVYHCILVTEMPQKKSGTRKTNRTKAVDCQIQVEFRLYTAKVNPKISEPVHKSRRRDTSIEISTFHGPSVRLRAGWTSWLPCTHTAH